MTYLLGVIGDPIAHSLSPMIHNHWLRQAGIDATYEGMQVPEGEFDDAIQTLSRRRTLGVNVTLPHKKAALDICPIRSETASAVGAANTLTFLEDGSLKADNTDVPGFLSALARAGVSNLQDHSVLVLGAGGAARGVVKALSGNVSRTIVLNRTEARAKSLIDDLGGPQDVYGSIDQLTDYQSTVTLVINTTSAGHKGGEFALPEGEGRLFFDISYGAAAAPQVKTAQDAGWRTEDGLGMLVAQAAESFQIWFGQRPDEDEILDRCRKLVEALT